MKEFFSPRDFDSKLVSQRRVEAPQGKSIVDQASAVVARVVAKNIYDSLKMGKISRAYNWANWFAAGDNATDEQIRDVAGSLIRTVYEKATQPKAPK